MSICGNYVELIENHKVQNDKDFIIWKETNLHEEKYKNFTIEVYIEKKIVEELSRKPLIIIDAATGNICGKEVGMLFIKPAHDKYGI